MTVSRHDFETAIAAYWGVKQAQIEQSVIRATIGAGTAGSVRGGKHFDAIATLLAKFFVEAGYPPEAIRVTRSQGLALPGYYRPQKQWDLVVAYETTLVAAFELKALGGPSFGNNYNNRVEEALGSAVDLRRAVLADLYPGEKPWLGYFFIMQDEEGSRRPVTPAAMPLNQAWSGCELVRCRWWSRTHGCGGWYQWFDSLDGQGRRSRVFPADVGGALDPPGVVARALHHPRVAAVSACGVQRPFRGELADQPGVHGRLVVRGKKPQGRRRGRGPGGGPC